MNIFFLDKNVTKCAQMHNDKHCVKMILEYSQLLSTAHRVLDGKETIGKTASGRKAKRWVLNNERDSILYSATHINHPSAIWVRQSNSNYTWLHSLLVELCSEYTYRYGRVHKCQFSGLVETLKQLPTNIPTEEFTEPTPALPEKYKDKESSIISYKNYYIFEKQHLASWKGKINSRTPPNWFVFL